MRLKPDYLMCLMEQGCAQAATQRITDILTTSGQAASAGSGASAGAARTAQDGTSSFQQQPAQQALPTVAVPTTFTHDTWNAENYGRKLQQQQVRFLATRRL
jgi:hypothetical protein